jgi:V/A-type H+-transporting ATPase subunit I
MIFTGKMRHLTGAVLDSDSKAATRELLRLGVLDLVSFQDIKEDWKNDLEPVYQETDQRKAAKLRERIETFFSVIGRHPVELAVFDSSDEGFSTSMDETERHLDKVAVKIQKIREEQRRVSQELNRTRELRRHLPQGESSHDGEQDHRYLKIRTGSPAPGKEPEFRAALGQYPSAWLDGSVLLTLKRDEKAVASLLESYGWSDAVSAGRDRAGAVDEGADREISRKLEELEAQNRDLELKARESVESKKDELLKLWKELKISELSGTLRSSYGKTARTFIFSGWVPSVREKELETSLKQVTENRCYLEWRDPLSGKGENLPGQVPVIMNNPSWLKPFEKLVTNFAIPAYGTVDPTIFVAVFYCAMFGLMFGDLGHGAVVFLAGMAGSLFAKKKGKKESFLFPLFRWCGASAMVAGLLFGAVFGMSLFPPLWFDYHGIVNGHAGSGGIKTITDILLVTIYFGILVIGLGLVLNWYNRFTKRDWLGLILDKGGLVGGWMYGAGTWCAFYFVRHDYRGLPPSGTLTLILGIPALLMAAKPVLEWRHHHRGERFGAMTAVNLIMEWIVELLEIFSGYLSNTLSFMRVAGLGIAHVSLMVAFFQIADMAAGPGGYSLWSVIILILGNVLVIGLEGLSAGIQSLRLNYYEFFSKYFDGSGRAYAPVSLKN